MITADQLVRSYIIESGETDSKYFRFLQTLISGLRQLNLDVSGTPSIAILPIDDKDCVNIPQDYIRYLKVGLVDGQGNVQVLGLNNNMALNRLEDKCGEVVPYTNANYFRDPNYPFVNGGINGIGGVYGSGIVGGGMSEGLGDHTTNGQNIGRFYGIGGGNNMYGYYKVDTERGVIQIQNRSTTNVHHHIFLEYLADAKMIDGEFLIHPFIEETLKAWIYWQTIQRNRTFGLGDKEQAKREYYHQRTLSNARFTSKTMSEWMATFRKGNLGTIKT